MSEAMQTEVRWHQREQISTDHIPELYRPWLFDDESLTAQLKSSCTAPFRVEVLRQRYAEVEDDEAIALDIPLRESALLREVHLYCGDIRMVYARSVIPQSTLTGPQAELANLGDRPLGEFLFACPTMQRGPIEVAGFQSGDEVYQRAMAGLPPSSEAEIWGRRSIFRLAGKPLLVAEIFLPAVGKLTR